MNKNTLLLLVILACVFTAATAHADRLALDDGTVYMGRVVTFMDALVAYETPYTGVIMVPADKITALYTDREYFIELSGGVILKGRLADGAGGETVLLFGGKEKRRVEARGIIAMTPVFAEKKQVENKTYDAGNLGQQEEKEPPLNFLNHSTVLLAPGNYEFELAMQYKSEHSVDAMPTVGYFEHSAYKVRQFSFSLNGRASFWEGGEVWLSVPFTHTRIREVSTNEYERKKIKTDLADISTGVQQLLVREGELVPAVTLSLGLGMPTGDREYRELEQRWLNALDNGNGHWTISPGIYLVKTTDPAIFFGGVTYQHSFKRVISGYYIVSP
jgi:hypothetical protein